MTVTDLSSASAAIARCRMTRLLIGSSRRLSVSAVCGCSAIALLAASTAGAQPAQQGDSQELAVEEIVVTGSRIARAGYDTLQPAVNLSSEFIDDRGFQNVADALNQIPAFGIGVSNEGRQGGLTGGQNFVNTFGLGAQRTLVLINGRRVVPQNSPGIDDNGGASPPTGGGLQVDMNIIPTGLIDRVETIFIGGAPIYGTDAVAGTVNIIMKDDFEGLSVDGQWGIDQRGDTQNGRIRGVWGANTADGRGNIILSGEYATTTELASRENSIARRQSAFCENPEAGLNALGLPIVDPNDGIPDLVVCDDAVSVWQVPNTGLPLVPGAFLAFPNGAGALRDGEGNPLVFNTDGELVTWEQANLGTPRGVFFSVGADGFDNPNVFSLADRVPLISPLDRWNMMGSGSYEIADDTKWFFEGLFSRSESSATPGDVPAFSSNVFAPGSAGNIRVNINDNPFITQQLRDVLILNEVFDPAVEEAQFFQLTRSNADITGNNRDKREQNVFRFVTGFEGNLEFFGRDWSWDTAFNFGKTSSTIRQPEINGQRFALALDAVTDPETGQIVCRAQIDPPETFFDNVFDRPAISDIDQCIPFNPFGLQQLTPEQKAFLVQDDFQSSEIRQLTVEGNIAGDVFDLPAGAVSLAGGFMHRRERAEFNVDRSTQIGIDPNPPIRNVTGDFDTTEVYGETVLPIVENGVGPGFDVPFLSSLQFEGALRFVDNSNSGNDVTWTVGGRLRPNLPVFEDSLTIRGNFTQSIRAPSVQELFLPRSEIATFAQDPCDPEFIDAGPNPTVRRANCEAEAAALIEQGVVPMDFTLADFESLIDNRTEEGTFGGNVDLDNEVADSWTVGAVVAPPFVPGLTLSVDWTSISIDNEITSLSATQILNACFDSANFPNVAECDQFGRDAEFQILNPQTGFLNAARREFRGLVSNFAYNFEAGDLIGEMPGSFEIFGNFFHNARVEREVTEGDLDILTGERGFERLRWQLNLRYSWDRAMLLWQTRHIGSFLVDAQAAPERFAPDERKAPAERLHNATFSYQLTDVIGLRVVVNNIFDNRDGRIRQAASLTGSNTDPFQPLDVVGRRFVFGVNANF